MTPYIHEPTLREGTNNIFDFTYVPRHTMGQPVAGFNTATYLLMRRRPGGATRVVVFQQGEPTEYNLPEDGTTMSVVITRDGLLSVVGDVICVVREQWARG